MAGFLTFFSDEGGSPMKLFGPLHWTLTFFVVAAVAGMYYYREKLRNMSIRTKRIISYTCSGILFANMAIYYIGLILVGEYSVKRHLPLEFCFITGYLLMYILIRNNRKLYRIVFYYTIIGPMPAMIWPNVSGVGDRYLFYQFIISHHFMLIVSFYLMIVRRYHVYVRDTVPAFVCGLIVFTGVYILNVNWGTNYIMSTGLPEHMLELYPILAYVDSPFFWLLLCGSFFLLVGVFISWLLQGRPKLKRMRWSIRLGTKIKNETKA